jgi:hypothetical protein
LKTEWLEENKAKEVINAKEKIKDKNLKGTMWIRFYDEHEID